jgi:hypothetical protein
MDFKKLRSTSLIEALRCMRANYKDIWDLFTYNLWPTIPPPHAVKFKTILHYKNRHHINILIETGTFQGEMVRKCRGHFQKIWTIELDEQLSRRAEKRLSRFKNIHVIQGNSPSKLSDILTVIKEPVLFWLDAHYSGGITTKGDSDTPILDELQVILAHGIKRHVILIDDIRCFGQGDYPGLDEVKRQLYRINPDFQISVANDILRCEPQA